MPFRWKKLSLQIQGRITFNSSSNDVKHWNYFKAIYSSEENWYKHRVRLDFSSKGTQRDQCSFFPSCKGYAGKTTSKVRKQTLRKDFHYDQKKYVCNLTSVIHTFAVHKDAITGNFCLKESKSQTKGKTGQGTSGLYLGHFLPFTLLHTSTYMCFLYSKRSLNWISTSFVNTDFKFQKSTCRN